MSQQLPQIYQEFQICLQNKETVIICAVQYIKEIIKISAGNDSTRYSQTSCTTVVR